MDNSAYKIICDDLTQLKNNYSLEVIPPDKDNILYPKRRAYSECAKMYYIWKLYKAGNISTKYVGFAHYRRVFDFKNNIPDLDALFLKYDVILKRRYTSGLNMYEHFKKSHVIRFLDESIEIVQEKYPEYYPAVKSFLEKKWANFCNIFIMKKDDFIKWGEFVYGVVLELDRRYNLTSDNDVRNLVAEELKSTKNDISKNLDRQSRIEGYIIERLSNAFYDKHFKRRHEIFAGDQGPGRGFHRSHGEGASV